MKRWFHAFGMCQSMFCTLPCPWQVWDEQARDRMLLFLPVVGLEIGAVWGALAWLCRRLALPGLLSGLLLCGVPWLLTGSIHLDGFMDVTDAVRSWRELERRRQILKDPHVGSFAVIGVVLVMLGQFALLASLPAGADPVLLVLLPAVSRCLSALAVTALPALPTSQYAGQRPSPAHLWVLGAVLLVLLGAGFWSGGLEGAALLGCVAGYGLALRRGTASLEGMNGDIAGYALTLGELWGLAVYALLACR